MKIAIVGGGITGLSAAYYIKKQGHSVTLFEKSHRLGGLIRTTCEDGFLFEKGPHTFRQSPLLLDLISDLRLPILTSISSTRYLLYKGRLRKFSFFLPMLLPHLIREPFLKNPQAEETVFAFAQRRFSRKIANTLFDPLCLGIYGEESKNLIVQKCFPQFLEGSVLLSFLKQKAQTLFTLKDGMQSLVDALAKDLDVRFHTEVHEKLPFFDQTFFATPSSGPRSSLYVVNLGYSEALVLPKGFGYLIPSQEKESLLGVIFDSQIFPSQPGTTRLTAMVRFDTLDPVKETLSALSRHLNIRKVPCKISLTHAKNAIDQSANPSVEACLGRAKKWSDALKKGEAQSKKNAL